MKHFFLTILLGLSCAFAAHAEKDITARLQNADFDSQAAATMPATKVNVVAGWTHTTTGDWACGAALSFGSGAALSNGKAVPEVNSDGAPTGGALGLSVGWSSTINYSQTLLLEAGTYRLHYRIRNANDFTFMENRIGFVADGKATYGNIKYFPTNRWVEDDVRLSLGTPQTVSINVGAVANVEGQNGSGQYPVVYVDDVRLYKDEPTDTWFASSSDITPTQLTGTGNYTGYNLGTPIPESWKENHFTGDALSATMNLENGVYELGVYAHAHMAWTAKVVEDGTPNSYLRANDVEIRLPVINNVAMAKGEPMLYKLERVRVTDGTLRLSIGNSAEGANWHTGYVRYVRRCTLADVAGDVNADHRLSAGDLTLLIDALKEGTADVLRCDANQDGVVDAKDVEYLRDVLLGINEGLVQNPEPWGMIPAVQNAGNQSPEMLRYATRLVVQTSLPNVERVSVWAVGGETLNNETGDSDYRSSRQSDIVAWEGSTDGSYTLCLQPQDLSQGVMVTVSTTDGKHYSQNFGLISPGQENTLQFTQSTARNLWMATLPQSLHYNLLSTPGVHDATTSSVSGAFSTYAKCQGLNISELLAAGVRAFDLRPRFTSNTVEDIQLDNLEIFHGTYGTGVRFKDAVDQLIDFVRNNPSEALTILMSKEQASGADQSETWRASIRQCFQDASRKPYLLDGLGPLTLRDMRGRICVVSRNPYGNASNGYRDVVCGAIAEDWPNDGQDTTFNFILTRAGNWNNATYGVQDKYNSRTSAKQEAAQMQFKAFGKIRTNHQYNFNFLSIAFHFPYGPASYAGSMNPWAVNYLKNFDAPLGYVFGDFLGVPDQSGDKLVQAIIEQNWKYAFK